MHGKKHNVKHLHVFESTFYILKDRKNLDEFKAKMVEFEDTDIFEIWGSTENVVSDGKLLFAANPYKPLKIKREPFLPK